MITVEVEIEAPLANVWNRWTLPEHITQWNFASDEWCCPSAINELEPGGALVWRMEARDGSMGFDLNGTYEEIETGKFISYTLEDGRRVKIDFTVNGDKVKLAESFDPEGNNPEEMQRAGWQAILDNFRKYVETDQ